jgi:hypothetical protein
MWDNVSTDLAGMLQHPGKAYPAVVALTLIALLAMLVLHLVLALIGGRAAKPRRRFNGWEKLVYLGTLASVSVLAVTSYYSVLRLGAMHGWWLFVHMFGAGAFVGALPVLALTWCVANRFPRARDADREDACAPRFFWIPKVMFWLLLVSGLVVILTMLLSMLPLFGTDGLHVLLDIHRYSGLLVVVVLVIHFYCVLLQRAGLR